MFKSVLILLCMMMFSSGSIAADKDRQAYLKLSVKKTNDPELAAKGQLEIDASSALYAVVEVKQNSGGNSLIVYGLENPNDGEEEYYGRNMTVRYLIDGEQEGFIRFSTEDIDYTKGDKWFSLQLLSGDDDAETFYSDSLINDLLENEPGKHSVEVFTQDSEHASFIIDTSSGRSTLEDGVYKIWSKRAESTKVPDHESNPGIQKFMFATMREHDDILPFGVILSENKWYIEQNSLGITESRSVGGYKVWQNKKESRKCELYGPILFRQFMVGGKFSDRMDIGVLGATSYMDIPCEKLEDAVYRGEENGGSSSSASVSVGNGGGNKASFGFLSIIGLIVIISNLIGGLIAVKPLVVNLSVVKDKFPQLASVFNVLDGFRVVAGLACLGSGLVLIILSILSLNLSIVGLAQQIISITLGLLLSFAFLVSRRLPVVDTVVAEGGNGGAAKDKASQAVTEAAQKAQNILNQYEEKVRVLEMYAAPIGIIAIVLSIIGLLF